MTEELMWARRVTLLCLVGLAIATAIIVSHSLSEVKAEPERVFIYIDTPSNRVL